jgi:hypothetical protein
LVAGATTPVTVTVTAQDGTTSIVYTVNVTREGASANHPPVPVSQVATVTVRVGLSVQVAVGSVASDPDGNDLSYDRIVLRPDGQLASLSLGATQLTVTGVKEGTTSIKVAVTDTLATAEVTIPVKVLPAPYVPKYSAFTLSPDMTGDGQGEVLAIDGTSGALLRFAPDKKVTKLTATQLIKSGLAGDRVFAPGDWDGDKKADVVTVDAAGAMWLRKGNGKGSLTSPVQIGRGWSSYRIVPSGDLNSDGANDMLAIDATGKLWLYAGDGKGAFKKSRTEVGHGWTGFDCFAAGDLNRDGKADILGINSKGLLYAYFGRGNGTFQAPVEVGHGWGQFTLAAGGDLNADGLADIVGRNDTTGQLYYYQSKGAGKFEAAKLIATGW